MDLSHPQNCWVIVEPHPSSGSWNMAVDEALLDAAVIRNQCTLRWYRWSVATVSLGYFQPSQDVSENAALSSLPCVRRLSGGGAIVHHHELTYSCTLPASHPLSKVPHELYRVVHEQVVDVLRQPSVPVQIRGQHESDAAQPFLCFGRHDRWDVVCGEHKILGSAQRRHKGAILQHGSLVLRRSEFAPEYPGICDLMDAEIESGGLAAELADRVSRQLYPQVEHGALLEQDHARATELERLRYARPEWNEERRPSRFQLSDGTP